MGGGGRPGGLAGKLVAPIMPPANDPNNPNNPNGPNAPGFAPGATNAPNSSSKAGRVNSYPPPKRPGQTNFHDLQTGDFFYFLSDTNKTYKWTKIGDTTAKNTVNEKEAPINGLVLVTPAPKDE